MVSTQPRQLLDKLKRLNEELADLQRQPLPAPDVQKVWLNGLIDGLFTLSLILCDVVLAAGKASSPGASSDETPGADSGGGSDEPLP